MSKLWSLVVLAALAVSATTLAGCGGGSGGGSYGAYSVMQQQALSGTNFYQRAGVSPY